MNKSDFTLRHMQASSSKEANGEICCCCLKLHFAAGPQLGAPGFSLEQQELISFKI